MPTVSYASIGAALGALGEAVAAQGSAEAVAAGRYISAAGTYADGIEGAIEGDTASHIMAGILGGVLLEAGIPISTAAPALLAALPAGLPPVVAGLAAAVILGALYYYGGEAIAAASAVLGSALADLLADALSDPLVLDLDGDGLELVSLAQSATHFDLDDDGAMERTGWVGPQDGLLVHDANDNGTVDGVGELFGSANVDGFDELETLDANSNGRIDLNDLAFAQLRVWRDLNSDGQSSPDEMQTLTEAGIASLHLNYSQVDQDVAGNILARTGTFVRADGTTQSMGSVNFALEEIRPVLPAGADLGGLASLPNLSGQLGLADLKVAMFFDPTLKAMVEDLTYGDHGFDTFAEFCEGGFHAVLYRWAGIDTSLPLGPEDQPYYMQALAAFIGLPFDELNPHQIERLVAEGGAGSDTILTANGDDTLHGGSGNDRLEGGEGADTYVYNPGDGDDVIWDYRGVRTNTLEFGSGITQADVVFSRPANDATDLLITFSNGPGSILIDHETWSDAGIELFRFSDGSTLTEAQANALIGGAGGGSMAMFGEIEQSYAAGGPTDLEYRDYGVALF